MTIVEIYGKSQIPVICGQFCEKWKETYGMERLIVWDSDSMTLVSGVVLESVASGIRELL